MIYHISEESYYQKFTNVLAIQNLCQSKKLPFKTYDISEFEAHRIDIDHDPKAVFIVEDAFAARGNWSAKTLRTFVPNGKIVIQGGDTAYLLEQNRSTGFNRFQVDLWLDTMRPVVEQFRSEGIISDIWKWTISKQFMEWAKTYSESNVKQAETRSVISLIVANTEYRKRLVQTFRDSKYILTVGTGKISSLPNVLFPLYFNSIVAVGTTSPSWTGNLRTMKGFRDWFAPFLGTVLIYDDHEQIINEYGGHDVLPIYEYDRQQSVLELIDELVDEPEKYSSFLKKQQVWAEANTIDQQLEDVFTRNQVW